ncbi:MAG: PTS sugar transporter subunit IIA [Actinomycetales bacterium]|jgi:PTS system fructose-specific IIA component|nr:PTS sugar transporter subunit IIA [Actinomycetales bacterium]
MSDLITATMVDLDLPAGDKAAVTAHLADLLVAAGRVTDRETFLADVRAREQLMPTGLEGGIGIPHARSSAVTEPTVAFGRSTDGVDFGASDGPARLVFLIAAPAEGDGDHLAVLAALARRLVHESFREALLNADAPDQVVELFRREVVVK